MPQIRVGFVNAIIGRRLNERKEGHPAAALSRKRDLAGGDQKLILPPAMIIEMFSMPILPNSGEITVGS